MKNIYTIKGNIVEITLFKRDKSISGITIIDYKDYDEVKKYSWYLNSHNYVATNQGNFGKKLHRLILHAKGIELDGDHFDRNKLNNQRSNLRLLTTVENNYNSSLRKDNSSGHIGVTWNLMAKKWQAQIQVDRKLKYLGLCKNINDAILLRQNAEKKYVKIKIYPKQ